MNTNKLYLITTNDKQYAMWIKQVQKALNKSPLHLDSFNAQANEMRYANYLAKASFVMYWSIQTDMSLAKLAPAMTQATMVHLMHRFIEKQMFEEVEVTSKLVSNFMRLLGRLDEDEVSEDDEE